MWGGWGEGEGEGGGTSHIWTPKAPKMRLTGQPKERD